MSTTRREFLRRVLFAAAASTALPVGHVATSIAAVAQPEPIPIAPGVDLLSGPVIPWREALEPYQREHHDIGLYEHLFARNLPGASKLMIWNSRTARAGAEPELTIGIEGADVEDLLDRLVALLLEDLAA